MGNAAGLSLKSPRFLSSQWGPLHSPQDLFDAEYLPSLSTAQKVAVWALVDAIRGPITIQAMMQVTGDVP
jgi:hypothetical protein